MSVDIKQQLQDIQFSPNPYFEDFYIEGYHIHCLIKSRRNRFILSPNKYLKLIDKINNAETLISKEKPTLIYKISDYLDSEVNNATLLDDICLLGSILTGYNWTRPGEFFGYGNQYPITKYNTLVSTSIVNNTNIVGELDYILSILKDPTWSKTYDNGFHLVMLFRAMNVRDQRYRFLALVTIWEFIHTKIYGKDINDLKKVMANILDIYFAINKTIFKKENLYHVLRNQLAHSGKLPIDRPFASEWMRSIPIRSKRVHYDVNLRRCFTFFETLTKVIVFRTLNKDIVNDLEIRYPGTKQGLEHFFKTGRIKWFVR